MRTDHFEIMSEVDTSGLPVEDRIYVAAKIREAMALGFSQTDAREEANREAERRRFRREESGDG